MNWSQWLDDVWVEFVKCSGGAVDMADKPMYFPPNVYKNPQDDDLVSHLYEWYNAGMSSKLAGKQMIYIET